MIARNFTSNFKRTLRVGLASLAVLSVAGPGLAGQAMAAPDAITAVHKQLLDKVTTIAGKTTHQIVNPTETHDIVVPGSHIVMVTEYHNNLTQPITNVEYTNPVPAEYLLADDSAAEFDVSVDGGKTFGKLASLVVKDGKGGTRAAQAGDVTTVRRVIAQIAPGETAKIEFHAIVR
jgi:hypothetical protein